MAPDKIAHLRAGALVAAAAIMAAAVLHGVLQLHPLTVLLAVVGPAVGAAVEWTQRDSNARLQAGGHLPIHDVSRADLLASSAPCLLLAAVWEVTLRLGVWP